MRAWPSLVFTRKQTTMASSTVRVLARGSYFVHPQEVVGLIRETEIVRRVDC